LGLRLSLVNELDDGALDIISGAATYATLNQDITFEFGFLLLFNAALFDVDDALPALSYHLAAE
jgi:hypothetical protein